MCSPFIIFKSISIKTVALITNSEIWIWWRYIHSDNNHLFSFIFIQLDFCYITECYYNKIIDIFLLISYNSEWKTWKHTVIFYVVFNVLTFSNITKRKAYLVIIWILIWFFLASFARKECNLTTKKLKIVHKVQNCIILQRMCALPLSTLNQFQLRQLPWPETARFEIGGAICILITAIFFFFFFFYIYFIQLDFCYITECYYNKIIDIIYKFDICTNLSYLFLNLVIH